MCVIFQCSGYVIENNYTKRLLIDQIDDTPCSLYCSNDSTMIKKSASKAKNSGELYRALWPLYFCCCLLIFFKIKKIFPKYSQSVNQFGS